LLNFFKKDFAAPEGVLSDMPRIEFFGASRCDIDNFKGLLDFSESEVRVNTSGGIVHLAGRNLEIAVVTDESVVITGKIASLGFE